MNAPPPGAKKGPADAVRFLWRLATGATPPELELPREAACPVCGGSGVRWERGVELPCRCPAGDAKAEGER